MTLCTKIDSMGTENKRSSDKPRCSFCYKGGHDASRCFKKKTCFKCNRTGHIAKFCTNKSATGAISDNVKPTPRTMLNIEICGRKVEFLNDPGSQVTIMTREQFDNLPSKPPFQKLDRTGTAVEGSPFKLDGIAHLNLLFPSSEKKDDRIH